MVGGFEIIFALLPLIIVFVLAIYLIKLFTRLVTAVEKIADKFENK